MRTPRRLSNVAAALAAGGLILGPVVQARAQTDAATAAAAASATPNGDNNQGGNQGGGNQGADLPSRVGRLAKLSGTVSFHTADEDHWDAATLNYPVTTGDAFWTEPQATASIEIAASRIDMASTTEFDVDQLDDHTLTATQAQGETFLDLRDMATNEIYTLRTPRGSVTITTDGQYEVASGDTQTPTTITVVAGAAQISGDNLSLSVQAGQTATITGTGASGDAFQGSVGQEQRDDFLNSELSAPNTATAQADVTAQASASASVTAAAPAAVRQMPGGEDLSSYGSWQQSPQYGQVWYPQVQQGWVPYRDGHWAWVAPWGWTWIDDEPWGYAPFHYGRWVQVDNRWAWAPVYYAPGYVVPAFYQPVYAPALVGFFGFGAGLAAGLAIGGGVGFGFGLGFGGFGWGHIGWCPLGWGEPYRPWFRAGGGYFDRVNRYNVVNIHNFTYNNNSVHNVTINNYANAARGATVVPTAAMLNSRRAADVAQPFSRQNFSEAHPVGTAPRPTARTDGVTPRVAQRLGLPDAAAAGAGHAAPGPKVDPAAERRGAVSLRAPEASASRAGAANRQEAAATDRARTGGTAAAPRPNQAGASASGSRGAPASREAPASHEVGGGRAPATHDGLPPLRTAGAVPRAAGGAPGPAFTPRARAGGGAEPGRFTSASNEAAHNEAAHGAPGPAIAPHGGAPGLSGAARGLPALRPHSAAAGPSRLPEAGPRGGAGQFPAARFDQRQGTAGRGGAGMQRPGSASVGREPAARPNYQAPRYQAPQQHYQAPRYQAPQQHYQAPRYQAPQQHYQAPRYQAPQQHYQAPRYQAPQQHYQAPRYQAPRYEAPARQFSAPAARPAPAPRPSGGGRRPFVP